MDRLRSLQYFVAAAEQGSFSAASRQFEVSVAAVAKLIGALERDLGIGLFERRSSGLSLTAAGSVYLDACRPALADLAQADEQARAAASPQPRGTVVVGMPIVIAQECFAPAIPQFRAKYPELQIDLRSVQHVADPAAASCDVLVLLGWPPAAGDWVHRPIGSTRMVIAASPPYWAREGVPQHPRELTQHACLALRGSTGILLDLWEFRRGDEMVAVPVRGWLLVDNAQRNAMVAAAVAGLGVAKMLDWNFLGGHELATGALVAALTDWESTEVPGVNLLYRPTVRRLPRVRAFMEFITQVFADLQQRRQDPVAASTPPRWLTTRHARASSMPLRDR
jgi:DNA-binding transcriptional LysR family regulator